MSKKDFISSERAFSILAGKIEAIVCRRIQGKKFFLYSMDGRSEIPSIREGGRNNAAAENILE